LYAHQPIFQQSLALCVGQPGVAWRPGHPKQLVHRRGVAVGVLPDLQLGQMEAEHLHPAAQVAYRAGGDALPGMGRQALAYGDPEAGRPYRAGDRADEGLARAGGRRRDEEPDGRVGRFRQARLAQQ
jgi:hypothetical protein